MTNVFYALLILMVSAIAGVFGGDPCSEPPISCGHTLTILMENEKAAFNVFNPFKDSTGSPLVGAFVQLGYFELADASTEVSFDSFVAIEKLSFATRDGGLFTDEVTLSTTDLPQVFCGVCVTDQTLQFGLRIFDAATIADAIYFNTVTAVEWQFSLLNTDPPPTPRELYIMPDFVAENMVWQDSENSFSTSLPLATCAAGKYSIAAGATSVDDCVDCAAGKFSAAGEACAYVVSVPSGSTRGNIEDTVAAWLAETPTGLHAMKEAYRTGSGAC